MWCVLLACQACCRKITKLVRPCPLSPLVVNHWRRVDVTVEFYDQHGYLYCVLAMVNTNHAGVNAHRIRLLSDLRPIASFSNKNDSKLLKALALHSKVLVLTLIVYYGVCTPQHNDWYY